MPLAPVPALGAAPAAPAPVATPLPGLGLNILGIQIPILGAAPATGLDLCGRAVRNGWFWVGIPLMASSFYLLLILLSWQPISFVIPASALSNVVGTLGAKYILKEDVNAARWAGVALVCIGVALVSLDSIPVR